MGGCTKGTLQKLSEGKFNKVLLFMTIYSNTGETKATRKALESS